MGDGFLKPYSDETHWEIDEVVRETVREQYALAKDLLLARKDEVQALGDLLLEKETINLKDIIGVLGARPAGMNETMTEYLTELTERLEQEEEQAKRDAEQQAEDEAAIDAAEDKNAESKEEKETKEKEDK